MCQQGHQAGSGTVHCVKESGDLGTTEERCREMTIFKATGIRTGCPGYDNCKAPSNGS